MKPESIGKYELVECLGRGGMGEVWKARDTQLHRYVAVKLLHTNLQSDPDFLAHFIREAQLVASLHHPNIVQVHDFQRFTAQDGSIKAYMVMDYIEGGTLADYIRQTSRRSIFPSSAEIVYLLTKIGLALDYAHLQGMIHRDIKPANILLDKSQFTNQATGEPVLTDFGIAKLQGTQNLTVTRAMVGTPLYISPEQARGGVIDARTDLYALGVVLYELLTGVTPFRGENAMTIMMQHLYAMPTPPALINPNIPPALSAVVLQSISKDPDARFSSASAMTVAIVQAFNLPIPTALVHSKDIGHEPTRTNVQASPGSSSNLSYATLAQSFPTSSAAFTPHNNPNLSSTPPIIGNTPVEAATRASTVSKTGEQRHNHTPTQLSSHTLRPEFFKRKRTLFTLVLCVILLCAGIGVAITYPLVLASHTKAQLSPPANSTLGKITFIGSSSANQHLFDQVQVDLENIPSPPTDKVYYAWLETSMSETVEYPHWKLDVVQGTIHVLYSSSPKGTDLFTQSTLFLITEEASTTSPIIPIPEPSLHKYYATITHAATASPSFDVRACPSNTTTNAGNPCI